MQIIFYAPLGYNVPPEKIGGGETGSRKTLQIYKSHGYEVFVLEKVALVSNKAIYLIRTFIRYLRIVLLSIMHPKAIVHIVGFYNRVIKFEWVLVKTMKLLRRKVVYEMRNGNMVDVYWAKDKSYRKLMRSIWTMSDGLLCQGQKYVDLIKNEIGRDSFLYPNFIRDEFIKPWEERPYDKCLNLVFFGRLLSYKNIDLIIEATKIIYDKHPQTRLHLIGGSTKEYIEKLESLINDLQIPDGVVKFHGHKDFEYIAKILNQSHFYLFPSTNKAEGHSNSLTEAMGCGVVPIVSPAGFNESVCGDLSLVIKELDSKHYAKAVLDIIDRGLLAAKSKNVYDRVLNYYTERAVGDKLTAYIEEL